MLPLSLSLANEPLPLNDQTMLSCEAFEMLLEGFISLSLVSLSLVRSLYSNVNLVGSPLQRIKNAST